MQRAGIVLDEKLERGPVFDVIDDEAAIDVAETHRFGIAAQAAPSDPRLDRGGLERRKRVLGELDERRFAVQLKCPIRRRAR